MRIDLHAHSTASDGTQSPSDVVAAAAAAGLSVLALTDHDTVAGWAEASEAAQRHGVRLVPGVEISCARRGMGGVHLLAYLPDPRSPGLIGEFERTRAERLSRAERMVERIGVDHPITWSEVQAQTPPGATVGRPHIADTLVAKGIVTDRDEAFADILHSRSPYYVRHYAPDPAFAVRLVVAAGGVPVLAHPRARGRGSWASDELIEELAADGLAGVEVDHRDNTEQDRAALRALAARLALFITGSSDYHGEGKQNRLGENTTRLEVYEQILAAGRGAGGVGG